MSSPVVKCPICNTIGKNIVEDGKDYFILNGNSPSFGISYCSTCLIGNSFPYLSDNELAIYYPENYEAFKPKQHFASFLQTYKYRQDLKIILDQFKIKHSLSILDLQHV